MELENKYITIEGRPMRILVTSNESFGSQSLKSLIDVAHKISDDVYVFAPLNPHTDTSHASHWYQVIPVTEYNDHAFVVDATPSDCILVATHYSMPENPDLILVASHSTLLDHDMWYSGALGAAMEGAVQGIPSIAISQYNQLGEWSWENVKKHGEAVIRYLINLDDKFGRTFYNVNFPSEECIGLKFVTQKPGGGKTLVEKTDSNKLTITLYSADPMEDLQKGYITVSPLNIDLTDYRILGSAPALEAEGNYALSSVLIGQELVF